MPSEHFWKAYNSSRCKTTMMVMTFIVTVAFCIDQVLLTGNQDLAKGFFAVMAYWIGRSSKHRENIDKGV